MYATSKKGAEVPLSVSFGVLQGTLSVMRSVPFGPTRGAEGIRHFGRERTGDAVLRIAYYVLRRSSVHLGNQLISERDTCRFLILAVVGVELDQCVAVFPGSHEVGVVLHTDDVLDERV